MTAGSARAGAERGSWLADAVREVAADPALVVRRFAAAGRATRVAGEATGPWEVPAEDRARAALVLALPDAGLGGVLADLDRHGDAAEKRGVLRALDALLQAGRPVPAEAAALVRAALRANDPRLVAAALGPAGASLLDADELVQAVLKCVFLDLDPRRVAGVGARVTPALAAALLDLARERVAAGRGIAAEVWELVALAPDLERLALLRAELDSPLPHRRQAARAALDDAARSLPEVLA